MLCAYLLAQLVLLLNRRHTASQFGNFLNMPQGAAAYRGNGLGESGSRTFTTPGGTTVTVATARVAIRRATPRLAEQALA